MAKVKLELKIKTDDELSAFATEHFIAITGNANFPAPEPPPAVYDPSMQAFANKLTSIATAEIALQTMRAERDALRAELEANLSGRGRYVEMASHGDEAKILSAGFQVQAAATPTTSLPAPTKVAASMGDNPGEVDVSCHAVPRARMYVVEVREHSDVAAPGPWRQAKISSRSHAAVSGLVSGTRYAFRMRAIGPNDLESPWSDEAGCMAP